MKVTERIAKLRALMEEKALICTLSRLADNHQSEYVGEHFKAREFITGFTGSAGTAIITKTQKPHFGQTGRIFFRQNSSWKGSGVEVYRREIREFHSS